MSVHPLPHVKNYDPPPWGNLPPPFAVTVYPPRYFTPEYQTYENLPMHERPEAGTYQRGPDGLYHLVAWPDNSQPKTAYTWARLYSLLPEHLARPYAPP